MTHDPQVMPFAEVTDAYVVTCPCGLSEKYETRDDAHTRALQHLKETR